MNENDVVRRLSDLLRAIGGLLAPEPAPELRPIPIRVDGLRPGPRRQGR